MAKPGIPIIEIFGPTLQGEGAMCGKPSFFIRTGGCPLRCSFCDSMHAVDPVQIKRNAVYMDEDTIVERLEDLGLLPGHWVTLTGGDPVMWDMTKLVQLLKNNGVKVAVETQGTLFKSWLTLCDTVTCSPKGPTSGMEHQLKYEVLRSYVNELGRKLVFKIVVFGPDDLDFVEHTGTHFPSVPMYVTSGTVVHPEVRTAEEATPETLQTYRAIAALILSRPSLRNVTLSPQMHVLIWGTKQGV